MEDVKIRLAVLWLFTAVALVGEGMLLIAPGVIEKVISGEFYEGMDPTGMLLLGAIINVVPLVMAFLSVTLKDSTNRWVNIIVGIFFTGILLFDLIGYIAAPLGEGTVPFYIVLGGSTVVASALIVWYAWKWPKQKD